jgi:hypothetical protein
LPVIAANGPIGGAVLVEQRPDPPRRRDRVDPALIADDPGAAAQAMRQHRAQTVVEIGVVAGEVRVASPAHLSGRDRRFGHGLEAQVIEIALLGV